jgi:hypothetical protein
MFTISDFNVAKVLFSGVPAPLFEIQKVVTGPNGSAHDSNGSHERVYSLGPLADSNNTIRSYYGAMILGVAGWGDESLTNLFLLECWERGIVGLRIVTPFGNSVYLRASLYHDVAYQEVVVLAQFMKEFAVISYA